MNQPTFVIEFKGMRNFDTLAEAKAFKKQLGDKYKATQKCDFPDGITFYTVYFEE